MNKISLNIVFTICSLNIYINIPKQIMLMHIQLLKDQIDQNWWSVLFTIPLVIFTHIIWLLNGLT